MSEVRLCTPSDWVRFTDMGDGEALFANMHPEKKLDKLMFKKFWTRQMDAKNGALFVEVDDSGQIMGILGVVLGLDFWSGALHANILCWHSIGRQRLGLFRLAEEFAKKSKCAELIAHSMLNHERLEKFYRLKGLTPHAREYTRRL